MKKNNYKGTLIAKEPPQSEWPKPESGLHNAICIKLIDMGTQTSNYKGKETIRRRFRIVWELYETAFQLNENTEMQPHTIEKEYTLSLHYNANLRQDLDSWRGVEFQKNELDRFEMRKILGQPCILNIVIKTSEKGRDYAKVENIIKMKTSDVEKVPTPYNKIEMFSFEDAEPNWKMFESLPNYLQDIINTSPEMQDIREGSPDEPESQLDSNLPDYDNDDVPF